MAATIRLRTRDDPEISLTSDAVEMTQTIVEEIVNTDYDALEHKPSINSVELVGDRTLEELGITAEGLDVTAESLGITAESLGITAESLGITAESLGIDAEELGMDTAGAFAVASLFA